MNHPATTLPSVTAVLPAAGIGSRMQADCPKQYLTIGHRSILEHAIDALLRHPRIQRVIVAISLGDQQFEQLPIAADPRVSV
ncbi:MAG: 2-C-methyl-D-erythritol 4-phosphate cytidylyltransferase, partial [Serratia symbiotica]|nr:2-C-methyl-D-erythritol 4-phosphate cytidylyltransferase [Serratia symbiotica]